MVIKLDGVNEELNDFVDGFVKFFLWVEVLKFVVKMVMNVGFWIRIKVKEVLELGFLEWVRDILEWLISKDVFKGNVFGLIKVFFNILF